MVGLLRKKRVTYPLDDEAKARLVGADYRQLSYVSSGSEHSTHGHSPCLSELVHDFLEDSEEHGNEWAANDFDSDRVDPDHDSTVVMDDVLRWSVANNVDPYRNLLLTHISEAIHNFSFLRPNLSIFRRNVMAFLRENGHNAAICKTRWDSSRGLTAGNYEFIDVLQSSSCTCQNRFFVDLDFAAHFEIARPTSSYSQILCSLPTVFVGTPEELKRTVRAMCDVAKRCLRSRGLSVPPWRKNRYMQNKWFAPYRRTTNQVQGNPAPVVVPAVRGDNCRLVGFDDVVSEGRHGGVYVGTR